MDKFMENPWFIRIVAFLLAMLMFISVNEVGKKEAGTTPNGMETVDVETIANVPLEVYYDSENLVVTGIPQMVDVKIEGQRRFVEAAKRQRDFEIYIDLSDVEIGKHRVPILYKDISEKLKVKIEPSTVEVSVQEKVTADFKVDAEFNRSILAEGFEAQQPDISPKTVRITGAKDVMDRIAYVKATIDVGGQIDDTIKRDAKVNVLDRELNKLDVYVQPGTVSVTIPVKNPRKSVPIKIKLVGQPADGIIIESWTSNANEAVIFGRTETLESIKELEATVDVSDVKADTEKEVTLKYPPDVNKLTPDKIKVKIKTAKEIKETTLTDVPIEGTELGENLDLAFVNPENGKVSIVLTGNEEELQKAKEAGVEVKIDLKGLVAGEHEVDLVVDGLGNIPYELSIKKAKISLSEKENV